MKQLINRFFDWYEKHYLINLIVVGGLFVLQVIHLYWLAADVVAAKLVGVKFFPASQFWQTVLAVVDYTEIPALLGAGLIYLDELKAKPSFKPILFLSLLLSQFLHIFWITDEVVIGILTGSHHATWPVWLAWVAILVDYGEVPVIIDTVRKIFLAVSDKNFRQAARAFEDRLRV